LYKAHRILNTSRCQKHKNSTMYFIIT